ncbi:hypothetical protein [Streptomyces sp. NPDC020597]|uniref:hypothetical protein n=1 Tax=unclassified Streptomyces TaxID=2593676 RepID=UPI00379CF7BC
MRGLRQWAAATGALTAALLLLLVMAPPAAAGGPASALLVSPTSRRTASLYGTDEKYALMEKLVAQTGSERGVSREEAPDWGAEATWMNQIGDMVTVSWMLPDARPWRTDRLYASTPDTKDVWIHTTLNVAQDALSSGVGGWHRAKQSEELRALLRGLGLLRTPPGAPRDAATPTAAPPESGAGAVGTTTRARATTDTPDLLDRAGWAIPALALGLFLGSEGAALRRRRASAPHEQAPPREPRRELLDS